MRATQPSMTENEYYVGESARAWLKSLGAIGFLFFFIKGLTWLILPFLLVQYGVQL